MTQQQIDLLMRLVSERASWLRGQISAQDALSVPVEPGRWRWADLDTSGYRRKPGEELAADQRQASRRATEYREELGLALATWKDLQMMSPGMS
jgi:hypothetical protein